MSTTLVTDISELVTNDPAAAGEAADTGFDLSVQLGGFGASSADRTPGTVARRSCMR